MPPTEARGTRGITDRIGANRPNVNIKRACPLFFLRRPQNSGRWSRKRRILTPFLDLSDRRQVGLQHPRDDLASRLQIWAKHDGGAAIRPITLRKKSPRRLVAEKPHELQCEAASGPNTSRRNR